jgi:hypothetical protein
MADARYDFYNPFLSATIIAVDGKRYPLWTKQKSADLASARLQDTVSLPFLQEVTVEIQLAYLPIMKATLTPPYRDAINFLNSQLVEWGQSQLEVQFGYLGALTSAVGASQAQASVVLSPAYKGILLKPEIQMGQDIVITLNAQGVGGFAAVRQKSNRTIRNATPKQLVEYICKPLRLEIDDKELRAYKPETSVLARISGSDQDALNAWEKQPVPAWTQGGDDHWTAILKITRNIGLHVYLLDNKLKILSAAMIFSSAPQRIFRLHDFPQGRLGLADSGRAGSSPVMPILSASSPTMAVYLPAGSQGFYSQDIKSSDRSEVKKFVGDKEVSPARTDKGAASISNPETFPEADPETGENAEIYPGDPSDEQFVNQVKSEYASLTTGMGIQLTLESLGDPTLLPGTVIDVKGLGNKIDGNYAILKITHTIGSGGYTMSLECVSNVSKALNNASQALGNTGPQSTLEEDDSQSNSVIMGSVVL